MNDAAAPATPPPDDEDAKRWRDFGIWLEQTYLRQGMTRRDLERQSGVQYSTLQRLEDGGRMEAGEWKLPNPGDATLQKLARFLRVPVEELYERAGGRARERNQGRKIARPRRQTELEERLDQVEAQLAEVLRRMTDFGESERERERRGGEEAG